MVEAKPNHRHTFSMSNHHSNLPALGVSNQLSSWVWLKQWTRKQLIPTQSEILCYMMFHVQSAKHVCFLTWWCSTLKFETLYRSLFPSSDAAMVVPRESLWQWQWPIERAAHRTKTSSCGSEEVWSTHNLQIRPSRIRIIGRPEFMAPNLQEKTRKEKNIFGNKHLYSFPLIFL